MDILSKMVDVCLMSLRVRLYIVQKWEIRIVVKLVNLDTFCIRIQFVSLLILLAINIVRSMVDVVHVIKVSSWMKDIVVWFQLELLFHFVKDIIQLTQGNVYHVYLDSICRITSADPWNRSVLNSGGIMVCV